MTAPMAQGPAMEYAKGPANELYIGLRNANEALRQGVPKGEVDSFLINRYGMTKSALAAAVKAMPQELSGTPGKEISPKLFAKAQAYGLTGGWSTELEGLAGALRGTGYAKAKRTAEAEMRQFEDDYPWLARTAKAMGLAGSAGGGAVLATTGRVLAKGGAGLFSQLLKAGKPFQALQEISPSVGTGSRAGRAILGGLVGANAGAGGMLDSDQAEGMDRIPNAAGGALAGGAAGLAAANPGRIAKILGLLGAGAGAIPVGRKVLDFLGR